MSVGKISFRMPSLSDFVVTPQELDSPDAIDSRFPWLGEVLVDRAMLAIAEGDVELSRARVEASNASLQVALAAPCADAGVSFAAAAKEYVIARNAYIGARMDVAPIVSAAVAMGPTKIPLASAIESKLSTNLSSGLSKDIADILAMQPELGAFIDAKGAYTEGIIKDYAQAARAEAVLSAAKAQTDMDTKVAELQRDLETAQSWRAESAADAAVIERYSSIATEFLSAGRSAVAQQLSMLSRFVAGEGATSDDGICEPSEG